MPLTYRQLQERVVDGLSLVPGGAGRATWPPAGYDYAADPALALTSVVFLPPRLARHIQQVVLAPLRSMEPDHYYYPPEALHLTIKNVCAAHTPPLYGAEEIARAHALFTQTLAQHRPFRFIIEQLVAFTGSLCLIGYGDEHFRELVLALRAGVQRLGLSAEGRPAASEVFFGNVTLCRYGCAPSDGLLRAVAERARGYRADLRVEVIHLITCNRACAPTSRQVLHSYRLGAGRAD